MVAQELALARAGAGRQARARVHDARRAARRSRCRERTVELMHARREPARVTSRTRSRRTREPELVERILGHRERRRSRSRRGRRRRRRERASTRTTGSARSRRRRSSCTATATSSSTRATPSCSPTAIPDARVSSLRRLRPPLHVAGARALRPRAGGVPAVSADARPLDPRPRAHDARPGRDRLPRRRDDLRRARRALRAARGGPARRGARTGRPRGDADGDEHRARRRLLRLREGGADPDAAEHAPRGAGARLPARGRGARRAALLGRVRRDRRARSTPRTRGLEELASDSNTSRSAGPPTTTGCCSSTPPARPASRRARCSRTRTASGRTSRSTASPASPARTPSCRCCRSSTVGGWNVQPLLAWWKGATVVLEPAFDAGARARADRREARDDDDGRARRTTSSWRRIPAFAEADLWSAAAARSSAARRCPRRCSRPGTSAASRSSRATG